MSMILPNKKDKPHLLSRPSLLNAVNDCVQAISQLTQPRSLAFIENTAEMLATCFQAGNKVLIAGNGGSLCDANHFAEELTGFFRGPRQALPALALSEAAHITCTANDLGFEWIFARGIQAFGKPGDVFVGLSTSGNSQNMIRAFEAAKDANLKTVAFLGKNGGKIKGKADLEMIIEGFQTSDRIQEAHMAAIHLIIQMLEERLFPI